MNLSTVFDIETRPDVVVEAAGQGELLGEHMFRYHLTEFDSAVEALYHRQAAVDREEVQRLLDVDVEPLASFEATVERSPHDSVREQVLDAHFANHYSRFVFSSNPMARAVSGTRTPFASGEFLQHVASLPDDYRMGTFPFTDGEIPYDRLRGHQEPDFRESRDGPANQRIYSDDESRDVREQLAGLGYLE